MLSLEEKKRNLLLSKLELITKQQLLQQQRYIISCFQIYIKKLNTQDELVGNIVQQILCLIDYYDWKQIVIKAEELYMKTQAYRILLFQGAALQLTQQPQQSMECLDKALKLKPKSRKINAILGLLYRRIKNFDKALEFFLIACQTKPSNQICYWVGKIYQQMNEHQKAILYFTKASDMKQESKFYIAKMNSFDTLQQYEQALECCEIVIKMKPQDTRSYLKKQHLLLKLGRQCEFEQVQEKLQTIENFYTEKYFYEKRRLETEKVILQKKQSSIGSRQTNQQIYTDKQLKSIKLFQNALFYTFTIFFVTQLDLIGQNQLFIEIKKYLEDQKDQQLKNFNEILFDSISSLIPNIKKLEIKQNLEQWYIQKIKENCKQQEIAQYFYNIFCDLCQYSQMRIIISDRIQEDYQSIKKRQEKNKTFQLQLLAVLQIVKQEDFIVLQSSEGQLGFEYSVLLLAYLIKFPVLANDDENFETIVFRLFTQKDLEQFQQSQSYLKIQNQNKSISCDYDLKNLSESQLEDKQFTIQMAQFQRAQQNN